MLCKFTLNLLFLPPVLPPSLSLLSCLKPRFSRYFSKKTCSSDSLHLSVSYFHCDWLFRGIFLPDTLFLSFPHQSSVLFLSEAPFLEIFLCLLLRLSLSLSGPLCPGYFYQKPCSPGSHSLSPRNIVPRFISLRILVPRGSLSRLSKA